MDREFIRLLDRAVKPYLMRGRPGDYEHTLRTVGYARELLLYEKGEEEIVIPALYLHDIGWSAVNYDDFMEAAPFKKKEMKSAVEHMREGARLSGKILAKLGYDRALTDTIVTIVSIHDMPARVFAMEDPSATMVVEADRMDRYGPESLARFKTMFGKTYLEGNQRKEAMDRLRGGLQRWFKTKTAKKMALRLARESGLLD